APEIEPPAAAAHPPGEPAAAPAPADRNGRIIVPVLTDHEVVIGYGRVGSLVAAGLHAAGRPLLVFEDLEAPCLAAREAGIDAVLGNAADPELLALANLAAARRVFVTVPEAFEAGQIVEQARAANPAISIVARAHSDAAVAHLKKLGADRVIMSEREIAHRMLEGVAPPVP
ncbi:NAD-binding protein, partial [Plastoroseomonas hellenica]|uniref:NAD-binding protein n=1 Tax=Plastoroseomonas hellenica TaxID=2687306 RepID=UPI001BA85E2F